MMDTVDLSLVPYNRSSETKPLDPKTWRFGLDSNHPVKTDHDTPVRYGECRRNHAARLGGNANDGCLEFMPSIVANGQAGNCSLTCAACGCHRNFHRKIVSGNSGCGYDPFALMAPPPGNNLLPAPPSPISSVSMPSGVFRGVDSRSEDRRSETPDEKANFLCGGANSGKNISGNKRFRTKFSGEQKKKMMEYADKVGWRIQRNDDMEMKEFCNEIGVKRHVLKVWMHNNKNTLRGKVVSTSSSPPPQPYVPPVVQHQPQPPQVSPLPTQPSTPPAPVMGVSEKAMASQMASCDIREIFQDRL